jgi:hypothetical protein
LTVQWRAEAETDLIPTIAKLGSGDVVAPVGGRAIGGDPIDCLG